MIRSDPCMSELALDLPPGGIGLNDGLAVRPRADYLGLGASLYTPATRHDLRGLLTGQKYAELRSIVACTEDAIHASAVKRALSNLDDALRGLGAFGPLRFVRPRSPQVLADLLALGVGDSLDGVCLPKLDAHNIDDYLDALSTAPWLTIMPILETEVAFSIEDLFSLRHRLDDVRERVICLRIGGNDLLQLMGMRRPRDVTAYETPLRQVIDNMILAFRPAGYDLAAPVYEHIDGADILEREVVLDVTHGLLAKTAIHPTQIPLIESAYSVPPQDAALAQAVMDPDAAAVFRFDGAMAEPATHRRWAARTLERARVYGQADTPTLATVPCGTRQRGPL
ncbi:MAG: HpcH/HpaI aldolase/citrate lyase family protein [Thiohalocapsa sp.]|nr:HpcH/HpaI aldolase/citrate lyase family protein [Thiohalocapsa sp.]MCF7990482.1 HpcH/HpaI aldolase/citrate lyase family protein [Thiohalocapsa sp.]